VFNRQKGCVYLNFLHCLLYVNGKKNRPEGDPAHGNNSRYLFGLLFTFMLISIRIAMTQMSRFCFSAVTVYSLPL